MSAMNVQLVDDNPLFLEALQNTLESSGIAVSAIALNAQQAIAQASLRQPDVILMDIEMPGESGIQATQAIKRLFPAIKIVMMTHSEQEGHLFDAIAAGASGYLLKSMARKEIVARLHGIQAGAMPFSPGIGEKILAEFARLARIRNPEEQTLEQPASALSERQLQILHLTAQGLTYEQIAVRIGLSKATISYHMGEIVNRLHMENRSQAIAYAHRLVQMDTE
jgi:two-component system NarL family response regulator